MPTVFLREKLEGLVIRNEGKRKAAIRIVEVTRDDAGRFVPVEGTEREIVIQESVFSRHGTDRVLKYAYELAQASRNCA